ncbi:hypothetical protein BKG82_27250 [Mycobacteroides chelonae]|uniref:Nucleotidyl transferase AbiEii/AbiGii toxin family protein n=1 Tax=Mycobacteroides chelonae TaxID=1774 RepID=A0A1S1LGC0_MYCCH|nr:nucleotidyl transferase AbiEii/AbiGii toxin family protein [Mycobacteroides chelonae]OHU47350.1 hypothetical protein BKG82_27250 [Mycobacteroides chelonae]
MNRLRDTREDLPALIGATAAHLQIDSTFVEKDFWVTEVLRAATAPLEIQAKDGSTHPVGTIFKGGTSLSRVFGLIDRFSEDVDLLIRFPDADVSEGQKDKALKAIRDNVAAHLELEGSAVEAGPCTKGVKRAVRYHYRRSHTHEALTAGVLLEMGSRGGAFPTRHHELRSMVAEHAINMLGEQNDTWPEFAAVPVEVLAPERTLLEKLALLHDAVSRYPDESASQALLKAGRHLYDVDRLLRDPEVLHALTALGRTGIAELAADIDEHSAAARFSFTPRPPAGYGDSPLLQSGHPATTALADGYSRATTALVYGDKPTFAVCIDTIRDSAHLL